MGTITVWTIIVINLNYATARPMNADLRFETKLQCEALKAQILSSTTPSKTLQYTCQQIVMPVAVPVTKAK